MKPKLQVVVPIKNERENICFVLNDLCEVANSLAIEMIVIVVDDGSNDGSLHAIRDRSFPGIKLITLRHETNQGYSRALQTGIAEAADSGHIMILDGDRQFSPFDLRFLLPHLNSYDVIVGYRENRADSIVRTILGKFWTLSTQFFLNHKLKDLNCGFKIFRSHLLKEIKFKTRGPGFNLEVFKNLSGNNQLLEVAVQHYPRQKGNQTGASPKTLFSAFLDLGRIFLSAKR